MKSINSKIQQAFKKKEIFFLPWVGQKYEEGLARRQTKNKVLVIGASRYCEYCKNSKRECHFYDSCHFSTDYDILKDIVCPYARDSSKRNNTHPGYNLCNINHASLLKFIYQTGHNKEPRAYNYFQEKIRIAAEYKEGKEVWLHIAFFNYLQAIVSGPDDNPTKTPSYESKRDLYQKSKPIVEKLISIIDPDVIFLWASSPIKKDINKLFDFESTIESNTLISAIHTISVEKKQYSLIVSPHPSDCSNFNKFTNNDKQFFNFVHYLNSSSLIDLQEYSEEDEMGEAEWKQFENTADRLWAIKAESHND